MYRPLSATRTRRCEIRPCLRILSASNSATRSAPVLAWRDGGNLCVCRAGRCGHRPLRLFIGNRCVGAGLPGDPSRTCAAALAKLSLRASDRRHWCGNPYSPNPNTKSTSPREALRKEVSPSAFVISRNDWIVGKINHIGGLQNGKVHLQREKRTLV